MRSKKTRAFSVAAILRAAKKVPEDSVYRLGQKVLIVRLADNLNTTVEELAPSLLKHHRNGTLRLSRLDLTAAFDRVPNAVHRSEISDGHGAEYHMVADDQ